MASRAARLGQAVLDLIIDDSQFHSKLSGAYKAAQGFTDQTGKTLTRAGRAISGVGESWTRNITAPIAIAGGAVAKLGLDFDTTMRQIVGLTDVTADQVAGIREEIMALGPEVGKGPQELAEAFYFIASAGFEADEAMEVLDASARAAASGLGETQAVAQVVGSVINAYGKENLDAATAVGQLVEAISQGTAEAPEFAGVIGRVAPTAASLGVTFDQVAASLAGMTLSGLSAEESATSLNQVLVSLLKPTADAEEALEEMGLSSAELRRQLKEEGLLSTLRTLQERFGENEDAAAKVFGNVRALRGVTSLLGLDTEQLNTIFEKVASSGAARLAEAYEATEGPQREIDRAMAQLQGTAIELGADVLPVLVRVLNRLADGAAALADWWSKLDAPMRENIVTALAVVAVLGPVLVIVGKLVSGVGALAKAIAFLAGPTVVGKLKLFGIAVKGVLGPIGLLFAAAELLDFGIGELNKALGGGAAAMERLKDSTGKSADEIKTAVMGLAEETGRSTEDILLYLDRMIVGGMSWEDAIAGAAEGVSESVSLTTEQLAKDAESFDTAMLQMARSATERSGDAADAVADLPPEVVQVLEDAGIPIGTAADGAMGEISDAAKAARDSAIDHVQYMIDRIEALFDNPEDLETRVQEYFDIIANPFKDTDQISDAVDALMSSEIPESIRSGSTPAKKETADFVQQMLSIIETLNPGALATGRGLPPAVQAGMEENLDPLIQWVRNQFIVPLIDSGLTEEEAWREAGFQDIGYFRDGILANQRAAATAAETAGNVALESIIQEESWRSAGRNMVDLIANGVDERAWKLQSAVYGAGQAARAALPFSEPKDPRSPLRGLGKAGEAIIDMVAAGAWGRLPEAERVSLAMAAAFRPDLSTLSVPSPRLSGLRALASWQSGGSMGSAIPATSNSAHTEIHHLNVNGMPIVVGSREDVLDGWDRLRTAAEYRRPPVS